MSKQLSRRDIDVLRAVLALKAVTVNQVATLSGRSQDTLRARVRVLGEMEFLQEFLTTVGSGPGRPPKALTITTKGIDALRAAGIDVPVGTCGVQAAGLHPRLIPHQLLISEFRVHLATMTRMWPQFQTKFLTRGEPVGSTEEPSDDSRDIQTDRTTSTLHTIPDGILGLTHSESQKTLLFFLEADRGTESLTSHGGGDIRQKILNYQAIFRSSAYRRHEQALGGQVNGFRVLLVADRQPRLAGLCRVVRETTPSDFVWLTDEASLSTPGIGARIWIRGGQTESPRHSILGSRMPAAAGTPVSVLPPSTSADE